MKGFVFNIQRYSVDDGPGIRTTIFLKGCNLNCQWCHNPESISSKQEILYYRQKCTMCGKCIEVCPEGAHSIGQKGEKIFERNKCTLCGKCVENCFFGALEYAAKAIDVDELVDIVKKDIDFYKNSGGGLTISGGEPLVQREFVNEVFRKTRSIGIHNALDTALNVDWDAVKEVLPVTDLVLLDLKVMDPHIHKKFTGVTNERILENAIKLSEEKVDIIVRVPVVSGVNDNEDNMNKTADFIKGFNRLKYVELLTYHELGKEKIIALGRQYQGEMFKAPTEEQMASFVQCFTDKGIKARFK